MDRNLGATRVATSSTDAASYGDLYQWGRGTDRHQLRSSSTTNDLSSNDVPEHGSFIIPPGSPFDWRSPQNDNLWQGLNGVNNPCPSGYRIPTIAEWEEERSTWWASNRQGAFDSPLKLPSAGGRSGWPNNDGVLFHVGSSGYYWASDVGGQVDRKVSSYLLFDYGQAFTAALSQRSYGYCVRCIKDE